MIKKTDITKENYLMFLDTETIGTLETIESVLPFEIGVKIYNMQTQEVVKERSYIIRKFFNNKYVMLSSFSASKYPAYFDKVEHDSRYMLYSVAEVAKDMEKIIKKYHINIMVAHNGNFDKNALDRLFNEFGVRNPFKYIDLLDTMEMSKIITYSKEYANFCIENMNIQTEDKQSKFITASGRVRTTAQAIYCYVSKNPTFKESHTALEDIDIEMEIFQTSLDKLGNTIVKLNTIPDYREYSIVVEKNI